MNLLKKLLLYFLILFIGNGLFDSSLSAQSPTTRPAESKPAETKPAESKPSDEKPAPAPNYDDYGYYKRHGKTSKNWNDIVKQGFDAYDKGDCEKVVGSLKEAVKAGCQDSIVFFKLGACSEVMGSYYSAAQYYKQAEDGLKSLKSPHRYQTDFYEAYGRALYMNQRPDEALVYLTKAADMGTPSFFLFYLIGEIFNSKKQTQAALEYFNKALAQPLNQATPAHLARAYAVIGKFYLDMKDYTKAAELLTKGLEQAPNDPTLQQLKYRATEAKRQDDLFKVMDQMMNRDQPKKKPTPTTQPGL